MNVLEKKKFKPSFDLCILSAISSCSGVGLLYLAYGVAAHNFKVENIGVGMILGGVGGWIVYLIVKGINKLKEKKKAKLETKVQEGIVDEKLILVSEEKTQQNSTEWFINKLEHYGYRCHKIREYTDLAVVHIQELDVLKGKIEDLAKTAHKKFLLGSLKNAFDETCKTILQNASDIVTICITEDIDTTGEITDAGIEIIAKENIESQKRIEAFKKLLRVTGESSIQSQDENPFSELGIQSDIKVAESFNTTSHRAL